VERIAREAEAVLVSLRAWEARDRRAKGRDSDEVDVGMLTHDLSRSRLCAQGRGARVRLPLSRRGSTNPSLPLAVAATVTSKIKLGTSIAGRVSAQAP